MKIFNYQIGKKERGLSSPRKSLKGGWNTGGRTFLSVKKFMAGWKTCPPLRETDRADKALKEVVERIGV